jgi:2-polyprenyl-3-methyl-5-hydroxy-6-metoxy-1,4-benzoquinol methylase
MKEMWDERYGSVQYAYGTEPNVFFKYALEEYKPGKKILFPADGEGRNSVYAATLGYETVSFDLSEEARKKALKLASERGVQIEYQVGDFKGLHYQPASFDAAVLIFAHFPADLQSGYHRAIAELVKPGGLIILEGFSKNNLPLREKNPQVGGPANPAMLFTVDGIRDDFFNFEILELAETETELKEGKYHLGKASLIRFVGRKL